MASGAVRGLVPIIAVSVMGRDGALRRFQAVIGAGFTGTVALPASDVQRLGLSNPKQQQVTFANGESGNCDVYLTDVIWEGERQNTRLSLWASNRSWAWPCCGAAACRWTSSRAVRS